MKSNLDEICCGGGGGRLSPWFKCGCGFTQRGITEGNENLDTMVGYYLFHQLHTIN
jgi:hypothetical protein